MNLKSTKKENITMTLKTYFCKETQTSFWLLDALHELPADFVNTFKHFFFAGGNDDVKILFVYLIIHLSSADDDEKNRALNTLKIVMQY